MSDVANILRGAAALAEMLECIGHPERDDHSVAATLTTHELDLRAMLQDAVDTMAAEIGVGRA